MAALEGLNGLSIGALAEAMQMSKSGLFAHFGSKEDLQVAVLQAAHKRFEQSVVRPAFAAPRGLPRLKKLFERWMQWPAETPGGCLFMAAAAELDDREGRPRDVLVASERQFLQAIARSAQLAIEAGHFRKDVDPEQFAFDLYSIALAFNHQSRLLHEKKALERARAAFDRLISHAVNP